MINPTQYIFVNKSLGMSPGKVAAQVAHAQEELTHEYVENFRDKLDDYNELLSTNPRTTIVLECKDAEELYKIVSYVEAIGLITGIYVDEAGEGYILEPTAMAVEYVEKDDPRLTPLFSKFELYSPKDWATETICLMASINVGHLTDGGKWRELEDCVRKALHGEN